MIEDERQLQQAMDQLGRMYSALSALRADVLPKDPERFRLMAEGPMEYIDALTREIREYSGAALLARLDMAVSGRLASASRLDVLDEEERAREDVPPADGPGR